MNNLSKNSWTNEREIMSTYVKMKKRRDHWKRTAVERAELLRAKRKEIRRLKAQRNQIKQDLSDAQQKVNALKHNTKTCQVYRKVDLVYLGACPRMENPLRKTHFAHIFRSFSTNSTAISLKRSKNLH